MDDDGDQTYDGEELMMMVRSRRHPGKLSNQVGQSRTAFQELVHHLHHHHHHLRKPTMAGISHCGNVPSGHHDHYHSSHISISFRFANINKKQNGAKAKQTPK